jgi:hypothetical protein
MTSKTTLLLTAFLLFAYAVHAQGQATAPPEPISDNSFLIEEAYNQEPGVVQHISTFTRSRGGSWLYTFTQEWPVKSMKHQFSYTLTALTAANNPAVRGLGDISLNYRYQLVANDKVAIAPRLSLSLPTGDSKKALGVGGVGFQTNLPISVTHSSNFVTHWNAGATFIPGAKNSDSEKAFVRGFNLGQSSIWLARPRFNVLVETVWNSFQTVVHQRQTETVYSLLVNPGVRWAYNFKSGLQIVPGVSVPIGVGPSRGQRGVLFYLSFEHPFRKITK